MRRRTNGPFGVGVVAASLLGAAFALTVAPRTSHAEQFVLFDALFTFTKTDADTGNPNKSHVYIRDRMGTSHPVYLVLNTKRPTNWLTPVDYRNGTVHIRTEVIDKPAGSEITQWILCYIPNRGVGPGYGCTGSGTYQEKGLYEHDVTMTSWWQNTGLDWTMGVQGMDLVMKDSDGGSGFAHLRPDSEKFFPTTMRITMIQVSTGSTYDPALVPGFDGGAPMMDSGTRRDSGMLDASAMEDTGPIGAGGSQGAGGAPGTSGAGGQTTGAGGETAGGSGGGAPGGAQGTAGVQGNAGTGPVTTGAAGTSATTGTTMGSPSSDMSGCTCSLPRDGRSSDLAYAALAALSAFCAGRRRSRRAS